MGYDIEKEKREMYYSGSRLQLFLVEYSQEQV